MGHAGSTPGQVPVTAPSLQTSSAVISPTSEIARFASNMHTPAIPAYVFAHDKNSVGIGGRTLAEVLALYYKAGLRNVEAVVSVEGQIVVVKGKIYVRRDKQTDQCRCWLYPFQPAQAFLRDLYLRYRGEAPRRTRRPMPVLLLAIRPK